MARLVIDNYSKIDGPLFIDDVEYGISTSEIQAEQFYIWNIHKIPNGEPPYKIGEVFLYKDIETIAGGRVNKIQILDGLNKIKSTKWVSVGLLKTIEPIINTIRGSIRLREI